MNKSVEEFIRSSLKDGLSHCNEAQVALFKRFYSHKNLDLDIDKVVDIVPVDRLEWALTQVENTVRKNNQEISK